MTMYLLAARRGLGGFIIGAADQELLHDAGHQGPRSASSAGNVALSSPVAAPSRWRCPAWPDVGAAASPSWASVSSSSAKTIRSWSSGGGSASARPHRPAVRAIEPSGWGARRRSSSSSAPLFAPAPLAAAPPDRRHGVRCYAGMAANLQLLSFFRAHAASVGQSRAVVHVPDLRLQPCLPLHAVVAMTMPSRRNGAIASNASWVWPSAIFFFAPASTSLGKRAPAHPGHYRSTRARGRWPRTA